MQLLDLEARVMGVYKIDAHIKDTVPFLGNRLRQLLRSLMAEVPIDDAKENVIPLARDGWLTPALLRPFVRLWNIILCA